jgi:uncharacterized C2H2 Zn-finger protein
MNIHRLLNPVQELDSPELAPKMYVGPTSRPIQNVPMSPKSPINSQCEYINPLVYVVNNLFPIVERTPSPPMTLFKSVTPPKEEKTFTCPFENCSKIFTRQQNLNSHLSVHSGARPFVCVFPGCTATFRRKQDLTRHKGSHAPNEARPYLCKNQGCLMRFYRADGLASHSKSCKFN